MGGVRWHFPAPEVNAEILVPYARIFFLKLIVCQNVSLPIMSNWLSQTIHMSKYFSGSRPLRHNEVQLYIHINHLCNWIHIHLIICLLLTLTRLPGVTTRTFLATGLPPYGPCFSNVLEEPTKRLYSYNTTHSVFINTLDVSICCMGIHNLQVVFGLLVQC